MLRSAVASPSRKSLSPSELCTNGHRSLYSACTLATSSPSPRSAPSPSRPLIHPGSPSVRHRRTPVTLPIPIKYSRRWATIIPENGGAILEKDPTYKPPEEVIEPPPAPPPAKIVHYHTDRSTLSVLCKSALVTSSQARASVFETVKHEHPLEIDLTIHEGKKMERPVGELWQQIRAIMIEQRENKSLAATPPAVLVPPENEDEEQSGIPDNFRPPMVVNWTTRRVCRGPQMYSQLEEMLTEMRTDQVHRLRLEDMYDAHLIRMGKKPPHRTASAPHKGGLIGFEKFLLFLLGWAAIDQWVVPFFSESPRKTGQDAVERAVQKYRQESADTS